MYYLKILCNGAITLDPVPTTTIKTEFSGFIEIIDGRSTAIFISRNIFNKLHNNNI